MSEKGSKERVSRDARREETMASVKAYFLLLIAIYSFRQND